MAKQPEMDRQCPRCGAKNSKQLCNYGRPVPGRFECFSCKRWWDDDDEKAAATAKTVDYKSELEKLQALVRSVIDEEGRPDRDEVVCSACYKNTEVCKASLCHFAVLRGAVPEAPLPPEVKAKLPAVLDALEWYVANDEVNDDDPENAFWVEGRERAKQALAALKP